MFFRDFYIQGMATVVEFDSFPVSSVYTLEGARVSFPGEPELNCAYVYSLGTLPEYRNRGYGAKVVRECARRAFSTGSDFVCVLPASDSLYRWYEDTLRPHACFRIREHRFRLRELPAGPPLVQAEVIDSAEYGILREKLLASRPHVHFGNKLLMWQEAICKYFGGGLYRLRHEGVEGCATVVPEGDSLTICELLLPLGSVLQAAAALSSLHPAGSFIVRSPVFWGTDQGGNIREHVVAVSSPGRQLPVSKDAYWGLAFD
jgi:GNAT superfamily N-acetyltransferase